MTKKHYIIIGIASYLIFLLTTIPAKPVISLINDHPMVNLQGISGTVWNGKISKIVIKNKAELQNTEWSFRLWKLLLGKVAVNLNTHYLNNPITTEIGSSLLGTYFVNDLITKIPAQEIIQLANIPLVQASGLVSLNIDNAQWKQGELPTASGVVNWQNATVTVADKVSLGDVQLLLGETEQQLLSTDIKNQGGDIKINGTAELALEANYIVNLRLSPNSSAKTNIKQSLELFAKKQSNGEYLFNNTGSLSQLGLM